MQSDYSNSQLFPIFLNYPNWTSSSDLSQWSQKIAMMLMGLNAAVRMMKIKILAQTQIYPLVFATNTLLIRHQLNYTAAIDQYLKITESQTLLKRIRKHIRNLISMIWKTRNNMTTNSETKSNSSRRSISCNSDVKKAKKALE